MIAYIFLLISKKGGKGGEENELGEVSSFCRKDLVLPPPPLLDFSMPFSRLLSKGMLHFKGGEKDTLIR